MNELPVKRMHGVRVWALRIVGGAAALALAALVLTQTGRYLLRAAWEEGKILRHRRPIAELVNDSTTPPAERQKLRLVLAARTFGAESIHLEARKSFTTFTQLSSDTLVLVLSGAYKDQLKPKTWWFPIVGRVPYKVFFFKQKTAYEI